MRSLLIRVCSTPIWGAATMNEPRQQSAGLAALAQTLPPAQRTLPAMLVRQKSVFGSAPFLQVGGVRWSHADAHDAAGRYAAALQALGVVRGDAVTLLTGNRVEFLQAFLGCGWLGAMAVPINTASMGPQIDYCLSNSRSRLLVIEDTFLPRLDALDLQAVGLLAVWVVGHGAAVLPAQIGGVPCRAFPKDDALPSAIGAAEMEPGDTLAVLYTSGTTGPSKGVTCPHAQYYWWGVHSADVLGLRQDDVLCTTLPLFHINALNTFAQAVLCGCRLVYEGRFSASGFWPRMVEHQATVVYLLGAMVPMLLAQAPSPQEREHCVRTGLGPGVPAAAAEAFEARSGVRLLEGYGSTETNFAIATPPGASRRGVMGWLRPGFDARVVDAHDAPVPVGEAGELLLRADEPFVFATGYLGMPEKTVESWRNLWFHTGDRVVQDADGAFRFMDRIKDAIRRRGENISSYEVEQVLQSHPAVAAVAVYPVQSKLAEDEVMTALVLKPTHQPMAPDFHAQLLAYCEKRLPYFAVPRYFDVLEDLPRTANGKVQKFKLREQGVTANTWDRRQGQD